jgi:hypothetical protein
MWNWDSVSPSHPSNNIYFTFGPPLFHLPLKLAAGFGCVLRQAVFSQQSIHSHPTGTLPDAKV